MRAAPLNVSVPDTTTRSPSFTPETISTAFRLVAPIWIGVRSATPLRTTDLGQADYQLLIDIRSFRIAMEGEARVEIALSARIVDKNGKVIASRIIEASEKLDKVEPVAAVAAFDVAFARIAKELIGWTVQTV